MPQLTPLDEQLCHQIPEPFPSTGVHHPHWRESLFFMAHSPDDLGDVVVLTLASYPQLQEMDSVQMGRVAGRHTFSKHVRPFDGDPHTMDVGAARVEIVRPYEEVRIWADPDRCEIGMDLTFTARTKPYGLRRGTMRAGHELIWDQSHMFQPGTYNGTYTFEGRIHEMHDWWGPRDHSWGLRNHSRCPLWLWFQVQLPDGWLGVWHWEYANGAVAYSDGCWASTDGSDPVPLVRFEHDLEWVGADGGRTSYGQDGSDVAGLRGTATFVLANGQRIVVEGDGLFSVPYQPYEHGGLNQMRVRTDDGRVGTAIFEVTGSHHHRYFPDTVIQGPLPA